MCINCWSRKMKCHVVNTKIWSAVHYLSAAALIRTLAASLLALRQRVRSIVIFHEFARTTAPSMLGRLPLRVRSHHGIDFSRTHTLVNTFELRLRVRSNVDLSEYARTTATISLRCLVRLFRFIICATRLLFYCHGRKYGLRAWSLYELATP